jgi:biotin synthase
MSRPKETNTLELLKMPLQDLVSLANNLRKNYIGCRLELCNILNAKSGLCKEDCKFCAQSFKYSADLKNYPLKKNDEIVAAAKRAKEMGASQFGIVTSGNRLNEKELSAIGRAVCEIRKSVGINTCASLGSLTYKELKELKDSGLSRYHHNIETSPRFYPELVTTHSFQERVETIMAAKEAALAVCSGGILGLGETWQDRIDMACLLKELAVDSVPLNFLVPIKGTPLGSRPVLSAEEAIRAIAIFRIILKDKAVKIAAGRERVLKDFQEQGFMAGANGMLIGGYLTVKGNSLSADSKLIENIRELWRE